MPAKIDRRLRVLAAVLALSAWGCGGSSSDQPTAASGPDAASVSDSAGTSAEPSADENSDAPDASATVDFELFSSDEGAGCAVYVAVPEGVVDESTDVRAMLWDGVVDSGFTSCSFSDVVEAGLITVGALDNYGQPDWATVTEHGFFATDGWDELLKSCGTEPMPDSCSEQVNLVLSP